MASTVTGEFDMTSIDHGNALHMRRTCAAELAVAGSPRFGMYVAGAISFSAFLRTSYRTCVESDARIGCSVGYLAEWNPACSTHRQFGGGRGEGRRGRRAPAPGFGGAHPGWPQNPGNACCGGGNPNAAGPHGFAPQWFMLLLVLVLRCGGYHQARLRKGAEAQ
jgi:hypothetical protein